MGARGPEVFPSGYRPIRLLGCGGMGEVWLAGREEDGAVVAVKLLARLDSESARRGFEREAVATLNLNHPHLVRGLSLGEEEGRPWLAMEYLAAGSLEARVERNGPLPEAEAVRIAIEAARGLKEAARAGIVHRDVKPANLLFTEAGEVKVCDLGLVAVAADAAPERSGTPAFMAPEQIRGNGVDLRADVYSLGLTLWFALVGRPPFSGRSSRGILRAQLHDAVPDPGRFREGLSDGIRKVVAKMTAKSPDDRYRLWDELIIDLNQVRRGESPIGAAIAAMGRAGVRRRWLLPALASAAGLFLLLFLVLALAAPGDDAAPAAARSPEEVAARAALDYARERIAERPEDLDRALDALATVAQRHADTAAGAEAAKEADEVRERIRSRLAERVAAAQEDVRARLEAGDLDGAEARLAAARRSLPAEEAARLADLADAIATAAELRIRTSDEAVGQLLVTGRFDAALELLEAERGVAAGGVGEWAAKRAEEVRKAKAAAEREKRAAAEKAYLETVRECLAFAAEGKFAEVAERRAADTEDPEILGERPRLDAEIYRAVERVFRSVAEGARARKGRDAALVSGEEILVGTIDGATDGGVRLAGRDEPVPIASLDHATAAALASAAAPIDLAAHALARGELGWVAERLGGQDSALADRIAELAKLVPGRDLPVPAPGLSADGLRDTAHARKLLAEGLDAYALGELARAVAVFREARAADPGDGEIRLSLGLALLDLYRDNRSPLLRARIVGELRLAKKLRPDLAEKDRIERILESLSAGG